MFYNVKKCSALSAYEYCLIIVMPCFYRGFTFRQAFSEVGDMRSLIPEGVTLMALTIMARLVCMLVKTYVGMWK